MNAKEDSLLQQSETGYDLEFADDISCPSTSIFSWPPPPEDEQRHTPTASPLYIPPPGTQRVQVTHYSNKTTAFLFFRERKKKKKPKPF